MSVIFIKFLFLHQMIALQKLWKMLFISSEKLFLFLIFVFLSFLLFLLVDHCFRGWSKINLKVNDAINCLNKNSITHFVWYLEKEKSYDIETLSIDGVSDKERFYRKAMQTPETLAYVNHRMPFFSSTKPSLSFRVRIC